jgi:hypothetical protein
MKQRKDFEESQLLRNISQEVLFDWENGLRGPYNRLELIALKLNMPYEELSKLSDDERAYLAKGLKALIKGETLNTAFEINSIKQSDLRAHYKRWLAVETLRDKGMSKAGAIAKVSERFRSEETIASSWKLWTRFVRTEAPEWFVNPPKKKPSEKKV